MSRKEFMEQLEQLLKDIPQEERIEALAYYNGYFEDAGVENEEKIIRELESPEKVAGIIKADIGLDEEKEYTEKGYGDTRFEEKAEIGNPIGGAQESNGYQQNSSQKHTTFKTEDKTLKTVLIVLLLICTCPLWLGLVGGLIGVIVGLLGGLIGILAALVSIVFGAYVAGIAVLGVGITMFVVGNFSAGLGLFGIGMLLLAAAILGTVLCAWIFGRGLPYLLKKIVKVCKRLFRRRERVV